MKTEQPEPQQPLTICQLCGKEKTRELSHILPRLVSRAIAKECGHRLRNTQTPDKVVQDTLKLPFLGELCEDLFEKYETAFAPIFRTYLENPNSPIQINENSYRLIISVCWRVAKYLIITNHNSPDKIVHLIKPERAWKNFLLGKTEIIDSFPIYMFLDRDFSPREIRDSSALSITRLRYEIGIGVNGYYGEKFTRQALQAKLGPFIICGHMRDLKEGISAEAEQWEEFLVRPNMTILPLPRKLPASVVKAIDANTEWSTEKLETMNEQQKAKQKKYADENLNNSAANHYVKKDIELFGSEE